MRTFSRCARQPRSEPEIRVGAETGEQAVSVQRLAHVHDEGLARLAEEGLQRGAEHGALRRLDV